MRRGVVNKFNRGEVDPRALLRDDVDKINNSCEYMENFLPQRLGPMQYRPGTKHLGAMPANNSRLVPFVSSTLNPALLSFSASSVHIYLNDQLIQEVVGNITINNGSFDSSLAGWTDASGSGGRVAWEDGAAVLTGGFDAAAKLWQTCSGGVGVAQCITVSVGESPITLKIGENGVDSKEIFEGILEPGYHSFRFTPSVSPPTFTLVNNSQARAIVYYVVTGSGTALDLPVWGTPIGNLASVRVTQSADVLFVARDDGPSFKIQRWSNNSWSLVGYRANDGPFGLVNNTDTTLQSSTFGENGTLTASANLFTPEDVGRLYKLTSASQEVGALVSKDNSGLPNSIRVTGVGPVRSFTVVLQGAWSGKVTLQRSPDNTSWEDVTNRTSNTVFTYNDTLDNSIMYYRLWVNAGDYSSGVIKMSLVYDSGSIDGICRVTGYVDQRNVYMQVLSPFGATKPTLDWYVSEWGGSAGFPSSVALYEGRLWWAGKAKLWGSVSDAYGSFSDSVEGDSAAIRRTIGFGPVDRVEWLVPSSRLIMGLASDEIAVRSSSFGEVLTNLNINLKSGSSMGAAPVEPVKMDDSVMFVQRAGDKLMKADYNVDQDAHSNADMMMLHPNICSAGIVRMAITRHPETRVYVVLADGSMRVHLYDASEEVVAWSRMTFSEGLVRDVVILPGVGEDIVYLIMQRATGYYLERMYSVENYVNYHFDGTVEYTSPSSTLSGLSHLEGLTVGVWGDGKFKGTRTVSGGSISITTGAASVNVGLRYNAVYVTNKVSKYINESVIGKQKRVVDVHLAMRDYWPMAVRVGPDDQHLTRTPGIEFGKPVDDDTIITDYDEMPFSFDGENEIDPRIWIAADGPCTILALSYGVITEGESREDSSR